MKRFGNLWPSVVAFENILAAAMQARRELKQQQRRELPLHQVAAVPI